MNQVGAEISEKLFFFTSFKEHLGLSKRQIVDLSTLYDNIGRTLLA